MKQQHKTETFYKYDGIAIHAAPGLHEFALNVILEKCRKNGCVLDLGCGSGAFTKRLQNHGFITTSADLSLDTFALSSESLEIDFNADFATPLAGKSYDAIVALEVIEHLENPLHFLRQLKLMAGPKTIFLVSFPNLFLYYSVATFIKHNAFANWSPFLYWETGHQTILPDWLFEAHLKKTGFTLDEKYFCSSVSFHKKPIKQALHRILFQLVCFFNKKISPEARKSEVVLFRFRNETRLPEVAPPKGDGRA